jgi:hypothetical protein
VNIFWVPPEGRWSNLKNCAIDPMIGKIVDDAMLAIERDNPTLKGVLPEEYVRPGLDKPGSGSSSTSLATSDFLDDGQVGWGSTEYIVLRPRGQISPPFEYLQAGTTDFRNFAIQQMTGSSGRQRVPVGGLSKYKMVTPEPNGQLFVQFGKLITPMFQSMSAAMYQSRTLSALRDALLPKLISGELRVPDAERIVARIV